MGLDRAGGSQGLWRGFPPQSLRSLHLLRGGCVSAHGQSGSSVAASPVRASPAGLSRRPAYAGARARRHRLRGTCWVPRCPPAPPPLPDRRARPPEPTRHDCRLRSHRPGEKQWGERETPRSQPREQRGGSEHRARARPPVAAAAAAAGASGRVRAAGAGRTCVCLSPAPGGRAGSPLQSGVISSAVLEMLLQS